MYNIFEEGRITPERNPNANFYHYYISQRPRKPPYPYGFGRRRTFFRFAPDRQSNVRRCLYRQHFQTPPRNNNNERAPSPQPSTSGISKNPTAPDKEERSSESSDSSPERPPPQINYARGSRSEKIMRLLCVEENENLPQLIPIERFAPATPREPTPIPSPPNDISADIFPPEVEEPAPHTPESSVSLDDDTSASGSSISTSQDSGIDELDATRENISPCQREDLIRRLILFKTPNEVVKLLKDVDLKLFAISLDIEQEYINELKQLEQDDDIINETVSSPRLEGSSWPQGVSIKLTDSSTSSHSESAPKSQHSTSGSTAIPEGSEVNVPSTSKGAVTYDIGDTPLSPVENVSVSTLEGSPWSRCGRRLHEEIIPPVSPASTWETSSDSASASPNAANDVLATVEDSLQLACADSRQREANRSPQSFDVFSWSIETPISPISSLSISLRISTSEESISDQNSEAAKDFLDISQKCQNVIDFHEWEAPPMPDLNGASSRSNSSSSPPSFIYEPMFGYVACSTPEPTHSLSLLDVFRDVSPIVQADASTSSRSIIDESPAPIWGPESEMEVRRMIGNIDARLERMHTMLEFIEDRFSPLEVDVVDTSNVEEEAAERPPSTGPPPLIPLAAIKQIFRRDKIRRLREQLHDLDKQFDDDFEYE